MKIRAAVLNKMGAEVPYEKSRPLTIEDFDLDDPGRGEVLVKIGAAGLCHSDLSVIDGNRPRPTPMVLGHEAAGIVQQVGPGVDDLEVGDHRHVRADPRSAALYRTLSSRQVAGRSADERAVTARRDQSWLRPPA